MKPIQIFVFALAGLAMAGLFFLLLSMLAVEEPVAATLVYQVQGDRDPRLAEEVARTLQARCERRGEVRTTAAGLIEIDVLGTDPEEIERIERLAAIVGGLEFRIVVSRTSHQELAALADGNPMLTELTDAGLLARFYPVAAGARLPNQELQTVVVREGDPRQLLLLIDPFNVGGAYLESARPGRDEGGQPCIHVRMNASGAELMRSLTNQQQANFFGFYLHLAVLLDGEVISVPVLRSALDRDVTISGVFSTQEARELSTALRSGMLPAPVKLLETRPGETSSPAAAAEDDATR